MTEWATALRLAATRFAIPPDAFWRLSVMEWAALTVPPRAEALDRAALETLMTLYPDEARP